VRDPRSADGGPQDRGQASGLRRPQRGNMPARGRPPPGNRMPERGTPPKPRRVPESGRPPEARGMTDRGAPGSAAGRGQIPGTGPYELARRPQIGRIPEHGRIPPPRPPGARRPPEQSQVPARGRTAGTTPSELARRPQPRRLPELGPVAPLRLPRTRRPPRTHRPPEPSQFPGRRRISVPRRLPERYRTLEARLPEAISVRLRHARNAFRVWRRTRPFWGGLLIICGASEILLSEHGPLQVVIHIGAKGLAGYIVPVMLLLCGILLWFNPAQRAYNSLLGMALALLSWITSNLGGFFIGMLLSLVGGALAFAWTPDSETQPLRRLRGTPQMQHSSRGLALTFRPVAALPPPAPVQSSLVGEGPGSAEQPRDSAERTAPEDPAPQSPSGFRPLMHRLGSTRCLPRLVRQMARRVLPAPSRAGLSEYGRLSAIFTAWRPRS
jgi:hypothetical protein